MNSRLAARDVDGGAYCCTGKAHHLARRLRAEPEVGGYACGPPPRVGSLCSLFLQALRGASISGLIIMPLQASIGCRRMALSNLRGAASQSSKLLLSFNE